jgi:hypothetical protein
LRSRRSLLALGIAGIIVAGCGAPSLEVVNRSERALAVGPGVTVPPCSTLTLSAEQFETARAAGLDLEPGGPEWPVPGDAVVWNTFAIQNLGGSGTYSIVISSSEPPAFSVGSVTDLPACSGEPQL